MAGTALGFRGFTLSQLGHSQTRFLVRVVGSLGHSGLGGLGFRVYGLGFFCTGGLGFRVGRCCIGVAA